MNNQFAWVVMSVSTLKFIKVSENNGKIIECVSGLWDATLFKTKEEVDYLLSIDPNLTTYLVKIANHH